MANDINKEDPHYKGEYGSIYEVNRKFPTGGVAGDFVVIDGWAHYWNADRGTWCVNAERDSYWDELITNIIEKFKLVRGATYMGVASLNTEPAKAIGAKMYYFATVAGKYKNFGDLVVPQGINVLYSENGSSWVNTTLLEVAQELGVSTNKVVSQKTLNDALNLKANQSSVNEALAKKADNKRVDDELAKKFDKENIAQEFGDSEDKVVSQFALPFREIESPEFIKVIVDAEEHFLFGIQLDGSIEWSKGIPAPIRAKLQEIINQCQQDKTDILEAINAAKKELSASIAALQEGKVDKEEGKSLIDDEVKECFRVIENEEFIMAVVDSDDRVLFGIYRATGKPYYPQNDMYHISQSEEFLWVILDAANHPLLGIQQDGTCWAAKAQWLDDIKAIKNVLSNIDETLKTFQPKEDGKGLINLDVADSFFYISNEEYIIAVVDAEDRILTGIKYDGKPYFPNHEMYSVITNEEWLYAIIDAENKVLGGFRSIDGHMVVGGIDISTFIANTIIDIADIQKRTDHLSEIENEEYLEVETDAEGNILSSTNVDGSHYIHNVKSETIENKVDKEKGKSLIDSCFADANTVVEDPEDRMDIKTDEEGKIISFRDKEGTIHEKKAVIEKTVTEEVVAGKVSSNDLNNIYKVSTNETIYLDKPAFIELWFTGELPTDLSDERKPTSLGCKFKKEGIVIFECNCTLSIQGHGSTNYAKKGYTFEPYNENGKALSIKFGDMIATDSFQLKAYATDTLHCRDLGGYALWHDMIEHLDYPYNKFNNIPLTLEQEYNKDAINIEDAFYAPKGFNCACYINEEFLGLYTLKLKKTRQNYAMFKNNKKQIFLDTYNYKGYFNKGFSADGWEVKNPKIKGYEAGGEISDTEVLNSITRFFDFTKDFGTQKANVDEFMVLPHWLVFIIFEEILHSKDINGNNYNVLTWDGLHWSIIPWDIDITLGLDAWNHLVKTDDAYFQGSVFIGDILKDMRAEYESQIKELYTKWRNEGFLSVLNISKYFKKQIISVPRYVYEKDYQKWGTIWTNGNPSYEQLVDAISRRLKWLDTQWLNK